MSEFEARFLPPETITDQSVVADPYDKEASDFLHTLQQAAEQQTGRKGDEAELSAEEREALLSEIAIGRAVEVIAAGFGDGITPLEKEITELDIDQGKAAERQLVLDAALLGGKIGTASLGLYQYPVEALPANLKKQPPLSSLAGPGAELEDRVQSGIEGALIALRRRLKAALPPQKSSQRSQEVPLKDILITSAYIVIRRNIESRNTRERLGIRIPDWVAHEKVSQYLQKKYPLLYIQQIGREEAGSEDQYELLQQYHERQAATEHISLQDIRFRPASDTPEDTEDWQDDESVPLDLGGVYPDLQAQADFERVENIVSRPTASSYLNTLLDRQRVVLRALSGFETAELDGPPPYTFKMLAEKYGVTEARIWGIEQEALTRLRRPELAPLIQDALDQLNTDTVPAGLFSGNRLKTGRAVARKIASGMSEKPASVPTSGEYPWLDFLKSVDVLLAQSGNTRAEQGTFVYAKIYRALSGGIASITNELRVADAETRQTPYPKKAYDLLRQHLGPYLTPSHIEYFWNTEVEQLLKGDDHNHAVRLVHPDRLGQLVSRLLLDCMTEADKVQLIMPRRSVQKCGFLGAWARHGKIVLIGHPGAYTGFHMRGSASVVVYGKPGHHAGHGAKGRSSLVVVPNVTEYFIIQRRQEVQRLDMSDEALAAIERQIQSIGSLASPDTARLLQAPQILDFNEAAQLLGVTEEALEHRTRELGHIDREGLTPEELLELRKRWPELGPQ